MKKILYKNAKILFVMFFAVIIGCVFMYMDIYASETDTTEILEEQTGEISKDSSSTTENNVTTETIDIESDISISVPSAILIEASTGQIIYEKNADEQLRPASVTKVMTLLLIFEALDSGKISLTDNVTVSEHAASMGGSQVFLEVNETQTVNDMIKCICISSANDASVAMAEYISGSEEAFVALMNQRAKELGMNNTNFVNCCGLDADGHLTTSRDISIMSRELTVNHKDVFNYTTIWMDTIIHNTAKGSSEFGLSNTNKLIKQYEGATGLKTGSTSIAKYSLSATATRNGIDLIAVVMAAPDHKVRFSDASKLLDYGFANCYIYEDTEMLGDMNIIPVIRGKSKDVGFMPIDNYKFVCIKNQNPELITKDIVFDNNKAPIKEGDVIGNIIYYYDGVEVAKVEIKASNSVEKIDYGYCLSWVFNKLLCRG